MLNMRKFVISIICSLISILLSVTAIFFLQAPLASLAYCGFFAGNNPLVFVQNIITTPPHSTSTSNIDAITIIVIIIHIALSLGFIIALFIFICKIIRVFLKDEKQIRPYYIFFFFMTSVVPVVIVYISILFKVKLLSILTLIITGVFTILDITLTIFSKKIFPETTGHEYRKYLFSEVSEDENN